MALNHKLPIFLAATFVLAKAFAPSSYRRGARRMPLLTIMAADDDAPAGSFFNQVPDNEDDENDNIDKSLDNLLKQRKSPPKATEPSTIGGVPTSLAKGFGTPKEGSKSKKPYLGLGPPDRPLNDTSNPEYDDQGYMLCEFPINSASWIPSLILLT